MKPFYKSKTIWAGIAAIVASAGLYFTGESTWMEAFLGAQGLVVILLRIVTEEPIGL